MNIALEKTAADNHHWLKEFQVGQLLPPIKTWSRSVNPNPYKYYKILHWGTRSLKVVAC